MKEFKEQIVHWLREGDEHEIADLLAESKMEIIEDEEGAICFGIKGEMIDTEQLAIYAPRKLYDSEKLKTHIEQTIKTCEESARRYFTKIYWEPLLHSSHKSSDNLLSFSHESSDKESE